MIYELLAKSSSGNDNYQITVSDENGNLEIECTCMAAAMGTMCKHRIAVITGVFGKIIDIDIPENSGAKQASELIAKHGVRTHYLEFAKELDDLKKRFKAEEKTIKMRINTLAG